MKKVSKKCEFDRKIADPAVSLIRRSIEFAEFAGFRTTIALILRTAATVTASNTHPTQEWNDFEVDFHSFEKEFGNVGS